MKVDDDSDVILELDHGQGGQQDGHELAMDGHESHDQETGGMAGVANEEEGQGSEAKPEEVAQDEGGQPGAMAKEDPGQGTESKQEQGAKDEDDITDEEARSMQHQLLQMVQQRYPYLGIPVTPLPPLPACSHPPVYEVRVSHKQGACLSILRTWPTLSLVAEANLPPHMDWAHAIQKAESIISSMGCGDVTEEQVTEQLPLLLEASLPPLLAEPLPPAPLPAEPLPPAPQAEPQARPAPKYRLMYYIPSQKRPHPSFAIRQRLPPKAQIGSAKVPGH